MHTLALHIAAGVLEHCQRLGILEEINTDLFQNGLGIGLDDLGCLICQDIDRRQVAGDIGCRLCTAAGAELPAGVTPASTP